MKILVNILLLSFIWGVISCSDKDDNPIIPSSILETSSEADYGAVILKWRLPEDNSVDYVNVSYSIDDKRFSKNISKYAVDSISGYVTVTINGFADTNPYNFELRSVNVTGGASQPITIMESPLSPAYETVVSTVNVIPDFGGGIVSWTNNTGKKLTISVNYADPDNPTSTLTASFTSDETGIGIISGLPASLTVFKVTASDQYQNSSTPVSFELTPLAESKILKDNWSVPGYVDDSPSGKIGYSSQSTPEGGSPDGRIIAIFDNDISTYWNADWAHGASYPHWFIIDMGEEVTVSRVELTRRQGNNKGHIGQQFLTCTAAGATEPSDPTTWQWEDQGEYSFDIESDDPQSYRLLSNPKARYLKVYIDPKFKGRNNNTMLAELTVYGSK
ncbi:DUF5126 domain-containing protein [Sunxiuqinia sp. sy24]|uniref:DUF5126 domain-containing protein n=1 Tax=Sunxiuqinia sp. sy24 TaxID=3461495 RepID=UPI0040456099